MPNTRYGDAGCGDPDCDACHYQRTLGVLLDQNRCINAGCSVVQAPAPATPAGSERRVALVALTEANAALDRAQAALLQLGEDEEAEWIRDCILENADLMADLAKPGSELAS